LSYIARFLDPNEIAAVVLVFCRIGTAFMLLPGFSFARVPVMFRALLAFVVSAAAYPFLRVMIGKTVGGGHFVALMLNELLFGLFFGFICALFTYAVRFFAHFVMTLIGLSGIPGQSLDDVEPNPSFVMIFSMAFTALLFAFDLHLVSLRALLQTYDTYPMGDAPSPEGVIETIGMTLRDTSLMALQAASPFILYGIGINFALGLVGKLTPQLQAYFALMGASIIIAFVGLYVIGSPLLSYMVSNYADWLAREL
jgi:flagellar biosynthesis protein FliR